MYEYSKMNLSGTDINVKDSTARDSAGSAKTEAENASGIATEALTTVREHSVKFASLEATTDAQGVDITTLKSQVGTGKLNTAASSLIPAVNEVNNGLVKILVKSTTYTGTTNATGWIGVSASDLGLPSDAVPLFAYLARENYSAYRNVIVGAYGNAGYSFRCQDGGADIVSSPVTLTIYYVRV